jgi:plasmid stabilization system protein ParE
LRAVRLQPRAESDAAEAANWYEAEQPGLGTLFLLELDAALERAASDPFAYQDVFSGTRRVLMRRFPYAVYFSCKDEVLAVFAILHQHRAGSALRSRVR